MPLEVLRWGLKEVAVARVRGRGRNRGGGKAGRNCREGKREEQKRGCAMKVTERMI